MLWENMREEEFKPMLERSHGVCAMAIGCMEKHSVHLPVGTDTLESGRILEMASEREEVCVFPKLFFGDLQGCQAKKAGEGGMGYGYVALSSELLLQMLREICDEIGRNGFTRILLFSGHGGNSAMLGNFIRAVRASKKDYNVFYLMLKLVMPKDILAVIDERGRSYFPALTDSDIAVLEDFVAQGKFDGHAGFGETSLVMGTYPELVALDRCEVESGLSTHRADFLRDAGLDWGSAWSTNFPNAYAGNAPVGLTKAIADAATELAVERTANALKVLKNDELMNTLL